MMMIVQEDRAISRIAMIIQMEYGPPQTRTLEVAEEIYAKVIHQLLAAVGNGLLLVDDNGGLTVANESKKTS